MISLFLGGGSSSSRGRLFVLVLGQAQREFSIGWVSIVPAIDMCI